MGADRRSTLIQGLLNLIGNRLVTLAQFARIADAAGIAAFAPIAPCCMPGVSDCGKWGTGNLLVIGGRREAERESQYADRCKYQSYPHRWFLL